MKKTKGNYNTLIQVQNPVCCGMDIHKKSITATLITLDKKGKELYETKEFETFTDDLYNLRDWLLSNNCPIVAMESTGIYWRPIYNVLEGYLKVLLVNARHIKNVPGKKTDVKDSRWIADLLRHGLLNGSFIPPEYVRDWRDLTRLRKSYTKNLGDYKRRVQKLFETANIKLDSVVAHIFCKTGRNLIDILISGKEEITLDDIKKCVKGTLKKKTIELHRSIQGFFREHHQYILKTLVDTIDNLEVQIADISKRINDLMSGHEDLLERLKEIPGVADITAQSVVSEIGPTLEDFKKDIQIASWAGLCPGNNESAGKRRSGKSPVRGTPIKTILVEAAWASVKKKGSYYKDKYYKLKSKIGAKKAIIAIAHKLLKAIFHIIKYRQHFKELGESYLSEKQKKRKIYALKRQAQLLGYQLVVSAA